MTQTTAQVLLTLMFLTGALIFTLLDEHGVAAALIGCVAGQGASVGVSTAVNGKNGGKA